jgi:phosphoribosyl 1,2-cyclic phosphodiesterase
MAKNPLTDIVMAAAQLKAAAPQQFGQFVEALRAYEKASIVDMVSSDTPHEVFRAQGGVKIIQSLRRHIRDCVELRATYQRRGEPNA